MSEKDDCKTDRDTPRSSSTKSAASEAVRRGAAKFRERLQRNKCNKESLRDQMKSAVKENDNNFKDEVQSSSNKGAKTTRDKVTAAKRDKKKGKNYPTPRSAESPRC